MGERLVKIEILSGILLLLRIERFQGLGNAPNTGLETEKAELTTYSRYSIKMDGTEYEFDGNTRSLDYIATSITSHALHGNGQVGLGIPRILR